MKKAEGKALLYAADVSALEDEAYYDAAIRLLSDERRAKVERYKRPGDRRRSLGAEVLLRLALGDFGVEADRVVFSTDGHGKPILTEPAGVFFNLSHAGGIALCAVSDTPVGCDVEEITASKDDLARRYFAPSEYERLMRTAAGEERDELFFRFWTLKESFMKATGLGMSLPLDAFSIDPDGVEPTVRQTVDERTFRFREFSDVPGYRIALALAGNPGNVRLEIVDLRGEIF